MTPFAIASGLTEQQGHLLEDGGIWDRVLAKLHAEPVEDLRVDLEDGYAGRGDDTEDADAVSAGRAWIIGRILDSTETFPRGIRAIPTTRNSAGVPDPGIFRTPSLTTRGSGPAELPVNASSTASPRPSLKRRFRACTRCASPSVCRPSPSPVTT